MKSVKLYGYVTSPFVRKTACFLYYKGIEFTHVPVNPVDPEATLSHIGGTQVPVLEIDGVYKRESSAHALWLDEIFPEKPLCPKEHEGLIKDIDEWISHSFLTSIFRYAIDGEDNLQFKFRAWRLASIVSASTPLSDETRHRWSEILQAAPFIQDMAKHMDLQEGYAEMMSRIFKELVSHLGGGPYIGGLNQPTMLDLALFPQLVWGYMFGLEENLSAAVHPMVRQWLKRMSTHLPENPTPAPDFLIVNHLNTGLQAS